MGSRTQKGLEYRHGGRLREWKEGRNPCEKGIGRFSDACGWPEDDGTGENEGLKRATGRWTRLVLQLERAAGEAACDGPSTGHSGWCSDVVTVQQRIINRAK